MRDWFTGLIKYNLKRLRLEILLLVLRKILGDIRMPESGQTSGVGITPLLMVRIKGCLFRVMRYILSQTFRQDLRKQSFWKLRRTGVIKLLLV